MSIKSKSKGMTDQFATVDEFGIQKYILGLSTFITECETPMTIAVQGDWGSGKTSVMSMVKSGIESEVSRSVWFNTWQYSQFNTGDALSLSLFKNIIKAIDPNAGKSGRLMEGLNIIGGVAKRVGYAFAENLVGGTNTDYIEECIKKAIDFNHEDVDEIICRLKDDFQEIVNKAAHKENDRIVVFIDDLDRLPPVRAVELLEVLKIFLECEKCVFVLAIDYNVVVRGVESKYGFDKSKGRSFFDKIIQVPFKMPTAQYAISDFVRNKLMEIADVNCAQDIENFVALIETSISSNPRSMKRLFNSFLLLLKVHEDRGLSESDKRLLFAIVCIQQRFEDLYNYIVRNREKIDADFFNTEPFFRDLTGEIYEPEEPEETAQFIRHFNRIITPAENGKISPRDWERVKILLECSSVTSVSREKTQKAKKTGFKYEGLVYSFSENSRFAIRLIRDYAEEIDFDTEELMLKLAGVKAKDGKALIAGTKKASDESMYDYTSFRINENELLILKNPDTDTIKELIGRLGCGGKVERI